MANVSKFFVDHCKNLVNNLQNDEYVRFINANSDKDRIRILYERATEIPIKLIDEYKQQIEAENLKIRGNTAFTKQEYMRAVTSYNEGLIVCPFDTSEGKTLYALLLANRAAAFVRLEKFEEALFDIDHVIDTDLYPVNLRYKIWIRKARCLIELRKPLHDVLNYYNKAKDLLLEANLSEEDFTKWSNNITKLIDTAKNTYDSEYVSASSSCRQLPECLNEFTPNEKYPALSTKVIVLTDSFEGRHIKAIDTIEPGEIVAMEKPHVAVLTSDNKHDHCDNCQLPVYNLYPCVNCTNAVYCSIDCRNHAEAFHRYECKIIATLYKSGASVNCHLALRTITQQKLKSFLKKTNYPQQDPQTKEQYLYDDYDTVYTLCNHTHNRKTAEYMHYSSMAIFLLRLLKRTNYFEYETKDELLTEQELLIGELILRHLQAFQFNAHEISDVRKVPEDIVNFDPFKEAFCTQSVGGGVYPTLALFNHSCDPSVVRYNKNDMLVLRAIKQINFGECVYDNYGPIYTNFKGPERQQLLNERYWFTCTCEACNKDWPLYDDLDPNKMLFPCKNCGEGYWIDKNISSADFICVNEHCKAWNNILTTLFNLVALTHTCEAAEMLYMEKRYEHALVRYGDAIKVYQKYLLPPCSDVVKIQQRMRNCMVQMGNIDHNYG